MDQGTPKPLEEVDVDSTQSSSSAADSVDVNNPSIDDVPQSQEPAETSRNDSGPESDENLSEIKDETSSHPNGNASSIPNSSVGAGEPTETVPPLATPVSEPISPAEDALEVIKNQDTHCLYCCICKSNITKDAVLFKKEEEPFPYNTVPYVLWLPRLNLPWIRRFSLSWIRGFNLSWISRFNPSWSPRNFKDLTLPSPRFLLALVQLVLAITVMWFHHSPVITPPGPVIPRPGPVVTPPGPVVTPPGPVVTPPGPVVTPPGPVITPPGPVVPRPGPVITPPGPVVIPPDPYIKRGWPIHFLSSKYLSIFSLLLLAILALLWPSISTSIDSLIKAAIERCRGIENPIRPLCRKARNFINYLKDLVTPTRYLTPKSKPKTKTTPDEDTKTKTSPDQDPKTKTKTTPDQDPKTKTDSTRKQDDDDEDKVKDEDQTRKQNDDEDKDKDEDQTRKQNDDEDSTPPHDDAIPIIKKIVEGLRTHIVDRLRNLDILKSIVYGGLIESITSLGVVSSAAASGATTLNVLALGVTSLFSGFILMCHSLRELVAKHKKAEEKAKKDPKQKKKETLYQTQLGNYRNVILHCVVVLASFLVFGLIPPLCYGLFFRETDKGHYKAAVVLVVSLVCVTLLASAKVYAFRMEKKLRTVWEYTGMAVTASALSFITSQIFSDMLEKYGFRKPASD